MKSVTIKDVANHCGYSFKTVARVISNNPTVAIAIREKVQESIVALGYEPNVSARNLRGGRSFAIGLVYEQPLAEIQKGALSACQRMGYFLQIVPVDDAAGDLAAHLEGVYRKQRLAGLLLTPPFSESDRLVGYLQERKIPFSRIISARSAPSLKVPTVFVDDYHAAYQLAQHLVGCKHRRIGFIWGNPAHASSRERFAGFMAALVDNHIVLPPEYQVPGEYVFASGVAGARQLMALDCPPTAIVGSNDEIAAGALMGVQMSGQRVPNDVAIAGFENSRFSQQAWPQITTASQPTEQIAERATELLIETIEHIGRRDGELTRGFLPELLVRESTRAD